MYNQKALSIFYGLTFVLVGATFLVISPSKVPEFTSWQDGIKHQFTTAWKQTIGDQPVFEDLALVYDSVNGFYEQSTDVTIALIAAPASDADIIYVFGQVYNTFAQAFKSEGNSATTAYANVELPPIAGNFMSQDPIYNIVPYRSVVKTTDFGSVSGATMVSEDTPVNSRNQWVTVQDNTTGQLYCLAIYNDSVNKYLGACKHDYY